MAELRTLYKSELQSGGYTLTRSPEAAPFWEGCRARKLMLPKCRACKRVHFYPRSFCPFCDSRDIEWIEASGKGTIYSYAIVRQPIEAAFAKLVPYCIGIVELAEGVRLSTRILGDVDAVSCGRHVTVTFEERSANLMTPLFSLDEDRR